MANVRNPIDQTIQFFDGRKLKYGPPAGPWDEAHTTETHAHMLRIARLSTGLRNRVPTLARRLGSTQVETTTAEVTKNATDKGVIRTVRVMRETWTKMSPQSRLMVYGYGTMAFGSFCAFSYRDGIKGLDRYKKNTDMARRHPRDTYKAIYDGCNDNLWHNMWNSAIWPWTIASEVMPSVIYCLHGRDPVPTPAPPAK